MIEIKQVPSSSIVRVRVGQCPHSDVVVKKLYGVLWSGELSGETIDEKLWCNQCKSVIMSLNEERVDYEF